VFLIVAVSYTHT